MLDAITDTATGALLTPAELPRRLEGDAARARRRGPHRRGFASRREAGHRGARPAPAAGSRSASRCTRTPSRSGSTDWSDGQALGGGVPRRLALVPELGLQLALLPGHLPLRARQPRFPCSRSTRRARSSRRCARRASRASRPRRRRTSRPRSTRRTPSTCVSSRPNSRRRASTAGWTRRSGSRCSTRSAPGTRRWGSTRSQPLLSDDDPKAVVVVLVGAGHVQYGLGIERQVRRSFAGERRVGHPGGRRGRRRTGPVADRSGLLRELRLGHAGRGRPDLSGPRRLDQRRGPTTSSSRSSHVEEDSPGRARRHRVRRRAALARRRPDPRPRERSPGPWPASAGETTPSSPCAAEGATVAVTVPLRRAADSPR